MCLRPSLTGSAAEQREEPAWQSMFSLYAHTGLDFTFPKDSLLHGRAISNRVQVEWGQFSVVSSAATSRISRVTLRRDLFEETNRWLVIFGSLSNDYGSQHSPTWRLVFEAE